HLSARPGPVDPDAHPDAALDHLDEGRPAREGESTISGPTREVAGPGCAGPSNRPGRSRHAPSPVPTPDADGRRGGGGGVFREPRNGTAYHRPTGEGGPARRRRGR